MPPVIRDNRLIDALETRATVGYSGTLWRVARDMRDPTQCSASGGRWDDTTFEVLYTADERDGAIAELHFHLKRGQPIFPSRVHYRLHELKVQLSGLLDLSAPDALAGLGVNMAHYGRLSYQNRNSEYPRTQQIAEIAHFLDFSGIIAPSARWNYRAVVIFCDCVDPGDVEVETDHGPVNWSAWEAANPGR